LMCCHTTVVLHNLPKDSDREHIHEAITAAGAQGCNFLYLPCNLKKMPVHSFCYAILNFTTLVHAQHAMMVLEGLSMLGNQLRCMWSTSIQGLDALVQKYRNKVVMHPMVPPKYRPLLLLNGKQIPFPPPTRSLPVPASPDQLVAVSKVAVEKAGRTTLVFLKLPKRVSRSMVTDLLDSAGFACCYDFVYLPVKFHTEDCFGHAVVNFVDADGAQSALEHFSKTYFLGRSIAVEWSKSHMSLKSLVTFYESSTVMKGNVPEWHQPLIFSNGRPVPFAPLI